MKQIKGRISICTSIMILFGGYTFAAGESESCMSCGSSPENLIKIINFCNQTLATIKTIGTKSPYLGKYVSPNRFTEGKFTPPTQGPVDRILRRTRENINSVTMLVSLFTPSIDTSKGDSSSSTIAALAILARNQTLMRDWKKLNTIEGAITTKKFELTMGGGMQEEINPYTLAKIKEIIAKYKKEGILVEGSEIGEGAEYNEIITVLASVVSSLKSMIAINDTERAASKKTDRIGKKDFTIQINSDILTEIQDEYQCAKWGKCNELFGNTLKDLKNIGKIASQGTNTFTKEISDANTKLKNAYGDLKKDLTNKKNSFAEKSLLQSIYGGKAKKIIDSGVLGRKNLVNEAKDEAEQRKLVGQEMMTQMKNRRKSKSNKEKVDKKVTYVPESDNASIQEVEIKGDTILKEREATQEKSSLSDVSDISSLFPDLIDQILQIKNDTIGSKDKNNSMIKDLKELCEKQCSNVIGKECAY